MHAPAALLLLAGILAVSAQFPSAPARHRRDGCRLPPETGPCLALFTRWHYSPRTKRCHTFTYGGCGGNANNFKTQTECECRCGRPEHPGVCPKRRVVQTFVPCNNTCSDDRDCPLLTQKCCFTSCSLGCLDSVRSDRCQLPPETGPCRARILRYFYSPSQRKCLQFVYGGCYGNSNNFKTKKECEDACGKISPEVCKQPKGSGSCLAFSEFYFYNSTAEKCEKCACCGCGGNDNRFSTKLECSMTCEKSEQPAED